MKKEESRIKRIRGEERKWEKGWEEPCRLGESKKSGKRVITLLYNNFILCGCRKGQKISSNGTVTSNNSISSLFYLWPTM